MSKTLAFDWSDEKNASIDWSVPEDALANGFTFLQLLGAHSLLAKSFHGGSQKGERDRVKRIFLSPDEHEAQVRCLQDWAARGLLTMRDDRWCRRCGCQGHTKRFCPADTRVAHSTDTLPCDSGSSSPKTASPITAKRTVFDKFVEHQQHLERLKLVAEKTKSKDGHTATAHYARNASRDPAARRNAAAGGGAAAVPPGNRRQRDLEPFTDERRRGVVDRMEAQIGIGFVRVVDLGEVKFFLERVDSGVKEINAGDTVTFKVDTSRDYPLAVDVRLEKPIITKEDTLRFIDRCEVVSEPMRVLSMLLSHRAEWMDVVRWVQLMQASECSTFQHAVHTLVELVTFVGNREPIHLPLLRRFLQLMTVVPPATAANSVAALQMQGTSPVAFYPDLVNNALERHANRDSGAEPVSQVMVERLVEVSNYVILLRQFTDVSIDLLQQTQTTLEALLHRPVPETCTRTVEAALRRLERSRGLETLSLSLIPSADELAVPPPLPDSPFTPANLPVNGAQRYASTEAMLYDQLRLLRADTFEATSRVLSAGCFSLPCNAEVSPETVSDVEHAHIFDRVRFMGRVLTRDRDFSHPNSFILQVQPKSAKANLRTQLRQGTAVCITTGLNRSTVEPNEVFWAVISSCDSKLLGANMIVVSPCLWDHSLDELASKLIRNERAGDLACSVLLETPVFIAGYLGVARALQAFVGPMGMPLPMTARLVGREAALSEGRPVAEPGQKTLLRFIPPHCEHAYRELTEDVRSRFALDAGQDAVMRGLPTTDVMLVQGPPGTGKSFIGCRVVEVYIRYKQLIDSGDILQKVSVGRLSSTKPKDLLPHVGPVVVITYKNHALDEFLVDLLDSGLWKETRPLVGQRLTGHTRAATTVTGRGGGQEDPFPDGRRLVRIGGRSREDRLDPHNLGALLRARSDKTAINSLNERIFTYSQRLDRLTKELHFLENGRVPRLFFERCLTPEQQTHLRYDEKDEWLSGARYVGTWTGTAPDKTHYVTLLRPRIERAFTEPSASPNAASPNTAAAGPDGALEDDEDVSLSVFQEMKREDEQRDMNDTLHTTYISAEALWLAQHPPTRPTQVPDDLQSPWSLDPPTRHEFYAYLIQAAIAVKARDCTTIMRALEDTIRIRNHAMDEAKLRLLQGADVVGLTTTGCAMNQNLLRSLRPSLLVVEEAAEVLESQLLACMTDSLQQVVLIGDHYQLQPKVDTFLYEKVNHLNLSMFERLARTVTPIRLTEQRRMHPDISALVRPFYHPHPLIDHALVLTRPFVTASGRRVADSVPGLAQRAFFWRHSHPEETAPGSRSKVNTEEVLMVQKLVKHLVHEGVLQSSITVITPYLGQTRMLRSALRLSAFTDIRVSTVDLYQGDENDIIILSLVRTEKLTEFIRMRNRLIVSCSRARFAMVIVGNDQLLHQSKHWDEVLSALEKDHCVGSRLPITSRDAPHKKLFMELPEPLSATALAQANQ